MIVYNIQNNIRCFLTAVFYAYKDNDCIITHNADLQLGLNDTIRDIQEEKDKADRVLDFIKKHDTYLYYNLDIIDRSCKADKYQITFNYIKDLIKQKHSLKNHLSNPNIIIFNEYLHKVKCEAHRFKGFIRFMENDAGIFYAHFTPDNNVTELIMPNFITRFKSMPFVIHDTTRNIMGIYNGKISKIIHSEKQLTVYLSENEENFQKLWKLYYNTVNIEQRKNTRLMKQYMPKRYWNNLPEKK